MMDYLRPDFVGGLAVGYALGMTTIGLLIGIAVHLAERHRKQKTAIFEKTRRETRIAQLSGRVGPSSESD